MSNTNTTIVSNGYNVTTRPSIRTEDKFKLWVRSGGRCAICNKYLLELHYDVNVGEMAHIVGWTKAINSPRGQSDLPVENRNTVENLVLLCADHHKIVDTKEFLEEFTIERLIKHKVDHEARIHHLTNLQVDSETLVLRMLGGIRGATIELSKEHARQVVFQGGGKFARFLDSFDKHGIEIDLANLPDPEQQWASYWTIGMSTIDRKLQPLKDGASRGEIRHLSVFALSRIPLLIYLGYSLDDKIPTTIYQKHRSEDESWLWSDEVPVVNFKTEKKKESNNTNIALLLSLSGNININNLPTEVKDNYTIYSISPDGVNPNRNILMNKASYHNFTKTYHEFLSMIEVENKESHEIHIFPAIPASAAISVGRGIMKDIHPTLHIYDFTEGTYKHALNINAYEIK